MRYQQIDILGGYHKDKARSWSNEDTCNWLPTISRAQNSLTRAMLKMPPGLLKFATMDGGEFSSGPIRGMRNVEGALFVVSGTTLFEVSKTGVSTPRGEIPGTGRVVMSHNQFSTGYQLLVENGQGQGGYVWSTAAGTFEKITDEGYPGGISTDYLDSYLLSVEPFGRFWFHSDLANATSYNTLDRYESEASPDKIVGLVAFQFEVMVFNRTTIEFFYNAGTQTGTFQNKRAVINRGCASGQTIKRFAGTVLWLGDDGVVYMLDGYNAIPISDASVEQAIAGLNWGQSFAFTWEDKGYKVYYLTFPDGQTFGFDLVNKSWHRRQSYGRDNWRVSDTVYWNGAWYAGDRYTNTIWRLDWDYPFEGDQPIVRERVSSAMWDNQNRLVVNSIELVLDTGIQVHMDGNNAPSLIIKDGRISSSELLDVLPAGSTVGGHFYLGGQLFVKDDEPAYYNFGLSAGYTYPPAGNVLYYDDFASLSQMIVIAYEWT